MFKPLEVKNISQGKVSIRSLNYLEVLSFDKNTSKVFKDEKSFSKWSQGVKNAQLSGLLGVSSYVEKKEEPEPPKVEEKKEEPKPKKSARKKR